MASDNDNGPVYLIVGGLIVAVVVFGLVFGPQNSNLGSIQPAAGVPAYTATTTNEKNTVITPPGEKGEPGVSSTTTHTKTETRTP